MLGPADVAEVLPASITGGNPAPMPPSPVTNVTHLKSQRIKPGYRLPREPELRRSYEPDGTAPRRVTAPGQAFFARGTACSLRFVLYAVSLQASQLSCPLQRSVQCSQVTAPTNCSARLRTGADTISRRLRSATYEGHFKADLLAKSSASSKNNSLPTVRKRPRRYFICQRYFYPPIQLPPHKFARPPYWQY
jgi:hypothetical protein